jgi:hypothetical protein
VFSTNVVEFKEPGVGVVEFVSGVNDLCGVADGSEKLVGKGGVGSIKALAPIVGEARVLVVKDLGNLNSQVFG